MTANSDFQVLDQQTYKSNSWKMPKLHIDRFHLDLEMTAVEEEKKKEKIRNAKIVDILDSKLSFLILDNPGIAFHDHRNMSIFKADQITIISQEHGNS